MAISLSIIIPIYNAARTVQRTLASLERIEPSRCSQVQIVIVDDGSTDNGLELVEQFRQSHDVFDWRISQQANAGANVARNTALEQAEGQWIFFLDADDELLIDPTEFLDLDDDVTCHSFGIEFSRGEKRWVRPPIPITSDTIFDVFSASNPYQPSNLLFRRACAHVPFALDIRMLEDWLFWMENPEIFACVSHRPDVVSARIHIHDTNTSSDYIGMGQHRARVARRVLDNNGLALSKGQRNNFGIQEQIGNLQAGQRFRWASLFWCPCNLRLYGKLWVYLMARLLGRRATAIRNG